MPRRPFPGGLPAPRTVARTVLAWFRRGHRSLPWRLSRDPYRIWVAEVLLQQTRVRQVVPYFERLIARYPTVRHLARAKPAQLLKLWQGAGYYGRAVRLHEAAQEVMNRHGGKIPRTVGELEMLPGVGPYTARAIASIAYGVPVVPADANVLRVAARWTREERDLDIRSVRSSLVSYLERALPREDAGGFAEALMELGETICLPRSPRCEECPAAFGCRAARELEAPGTLPRRKARAPRPHVRAAVVALARGDRWLVQRRPSSGLLGGLWEFPGGKIEPGESPRVAALRELREETGARAARVRAVGVVHHAYSHFTIELHVFRATVRRPPEPARGRRWLTFDGIARLPLPRATELIVRALRSASMDHSPATGPATASRARSRRLKRPRAAKERGPPGG